MSPSTDRTPTDAYARAHPTWHEEDAPAKAAGVHAVLAALGWWPDDVLDVGCGTGAVLSVLADRLEAEGRPRPRLTGWEIAPEAAGRAAPGVRLHIGDATTDAASAGLLLCLDVAEHVPDPIAFLARLRPLAPRLILRLPLDLSVLDLLRPHRLLAARRDFGHRHAWTRALALAVVREAGLVPVRVLYHRVPPPRDTARRALVDTVRLALFAVSPDRAVDLVGGWSLLVACVPRAGSDTPGLHSARPSEDG